jgi:Ca2+-dependent lipid-binding protein
MELLGSTEQQNDTLNPNWNRRLAAQYFFEQKQPMRVEVYDSDSVSEADFLGKA